MALTALQMVNELLCRVGLREVSSFSGTAGANETVALRRLNIAIQMIVTAHPFTWAMKRTPGALTAVAGTANYTLATDVACLVAAKHTYNGGGAIDVVDRETLEQYRPSRSDSAQRSTPRFMCVTGSVQASVSDTPAKEVEVWPVPDANFAGQAMTYYYSFIFPDLAAVTDISLIPGDFHWLIIDIAETLWRTGIIRTGGDNMQSQLDLYSIADTRAKSGLARLISLEQSLGAKQGSWEPDEPSL